MITAARALGAVVLAALASTTALAQSQGALIFAGDTESSLIRVYDPDGNELGQITNPLLNGPSLVVADAATKTIITDTNTDQGTELVRLDLAGNIVARASATAIFGKRAAVTDVIPSNRGTFFVTTTLRTPNEIAEVDAGFQLLRRFPSGAPDADGLHMTGGALSPDGAKLLVADANGQHGTGFVHIYDSVTGAEVGRISTSQFLQNPVDLVFDRRGFLYVADRGASQIEDRILVFDRNLELVNVFTSGAPVHVNFGDIAILPDDNLVVIETNFPTETPVRILSPSGGLVREFGAGLRNPNGIAVLGPSCPMDIADRLDLFQSNIKPFPFSSLRLQLVLVRNRTESPLEGQPVLLLDDLRHARALTPLTTRCFSGTPDPVVLMEPAGDRILMPGEVAGALIFFWQTSPEPVTYTPRLFAAPRR
jgi:DNA-binding beta-propeller fold protein YncE